MGLKEQAFLAYYSRRQRDIFEVKNICESWELEREIILGRDKKLKENKENG